MCKSHVYDVSTVDISGLKYAEVKARGSSQKREFKIAVTEAWQGSGPILSGV